MYRLGGFSTIPSTISHEYSWEIKKAKPQQPLIEPALMRMLEVAAIKATGGRPNTDGGYPKSDIQTRSEKTPDIFWTPSDSKKGPRFPTGNVGSDYEKYGKALPRFAKASEALVYMNGQKLDPAQILFRYDTESLNLVARDNFMRAEEEKRRRQGSEYKPSIFIPPHDTQIKHAYDGFFKRVGVTLLGRLWSTAAREGRGNERGEYYLDVGEASQTTLSKLKKNLSPDEAIALRTRYALPASPDRMSVVSSKTWEKTPSSGNIVRVSRTIGGGEQIIGNPDAFKF